MPRKHKIDPDAIVIGIPPPGEGTKIVRRPFRLAASYFGISQDRLRIGLRTGKFIQKCRRTFKLEGRAA